MENNTGIKVEFGKVVLDSISSKTFDNGNVSHSAMFRQEVKIFYPKARMSSDRQANLFSDEQLGIEYNDAVIQNRVAFMKVTENVTEEMIRTELAKYPNAKIYKELSNHPILSDNDKTAIANGILDEDTLAEKQVARYSENHDTKPGQLILDKNGKIQYRRLDIDWKGEKDDVDNRTEDPTDVYLTASIEKELVETGAYVIEEQAV